MYKKIRNLKDGWEITLSIFAMLVSLVILFLSLRMQNQAQQIAEENEYLRYSLKKVCQYIDTLPKKKHAVFEACLENSIRR